MLPVNGLATGGAVGGDFCIKIGRGSCSWIDGAGSPIDPGGTGGLSTGLVSKLVLLGDFALGEGKEAPANASNPLLVPPEPLPEALGNPESNSDKPPLPKALDPKASAEPVVAADASKPELPKAEAPPKASPAGALSKAPKVSPAPKPVVSKAVAKSAEFPDRGSPMTNSSSSSIES